MYKHLPSICKIIFAFVFVTTIEVTAKPTKSSLTPSSGKSFITTLANRLDAEIPANFFKPKVDFTTGTGPLSVAIGDLDGDSKPDMVVANQNSNTISVLHNISTSGSITTSSFAAHVDFATGTFTSYVAIGDVDGDGKPDLVVVNNNNISVLRNTSTSGSITASSFAAKVDFDLVFTGPVAVAIGDLDGDSKPDLVAANASSNSVSVLRNTSTPGSISVAAKVDFAAGGTPFSIAIGDLDGDGKPDLVVANASPGTNTVSVLRNTSTSGSITASSFAAKVPFATGPTPRSVAIGDVDGDGKPDLVVANSESTSTTVSVLRNTSTSGSITASSFAVKVDFATGISPYSVAVGDLDGDSKIDIVVSNQNSNTISVLRNTSTSGTISAATKVDFATGLSPRSVAIGDLDGDGIPEVAAGNFSSNSVSIFQKDPSALPISLSNVKAYQKNAGVQVEWVIQQESNTDRYEVEKSQNGQQFIKLGTVEAKGNSNNAITYNLFDPNPFSGANFYRIKIIEAGGVRYSLIVKVNLSNGSVNIITIYPNPMKGNTIALQMNLQKGIYIIALTNKLGQQIMNKVIRHAGGSASESIELSKVLAAGVYQLRLSGGGVNVTRQVIKN